MRGDEIQNTKKELALIGTVSMILNNTREGRNWN